MLSGLIDSGYFSRQEILFMRIFWSDDELHRISIKYANDSLGKNTVSIEAARSA